MESLIPVLMITFDMLWRKNPPQSINWIYGYRSRRSMKNNKTWKFAHLYQAKMWRWSGIILLVFSLVFALSFKKIIKKYLVGFSVLN